MEQTAPDWRRFDSLIRREYKSRTLEELMQFMNRTHGFKATKSQYEKRFKDNGVRKKRPKSDWKSLGQLIRRRQSKGKRSDVYIDNELVTEQKLKKELSHHGHMTVIEQLAAAEEPIASVGLSLGTSVGGHEPPFIQHSLETILPDHFPASWFALDKPNRPETIPILNMTMFLLSNNLFAPSEGPSIFGQLKTHGLLQYLDVLCLMESRTAESVRETLFRLAVETEDVVLTRRLIKAGVDPNGPRCWNLSLENYLSPLEFVCFSGHIEMALELMKGGTKLNGTGNIYTPGILALTILYFRDYIIGLPEVGHLEKLIDLLKVMITAGADINASFQIPLVSSFGPPLGKAAYHFDRRRFTPLEAAASCGSLPVLLFLVQNGADVNIMTDSRRSVLQLWLDGWAHTGNEDFSRGQGFRIHAQISEAEIMEGIVALLDAGALVNAAAGFGLERPPVVSAARLGGDILNLILHRGAKITSKEVWQSVQNPAVFAVGLHLVEYAFRDDTTAIESISQAGIGIIAATWTALSPLSKDNILRALRSSNQTTSIHFLIAALRNETLSLIDSLVSSIQLHFGSSTELQEAVEELSHAGMCCGILHLVHHGGIYRHSMLLFLYRMIGDVIQARCYELVDILLSEGADINASISTGRYRGRSPLVAAIDIRNLDLALELIRRGAWVVRPGTCDVCSQESPTADALVSVIYWGNERVIRAVLEKSVDLDLPGYNCSYENLTQPSSSYRAAIYHQSRYSTALVAAIECSNWSLVQHLIQRSASVNGHHLLEPQMSALALAALRENDECVQMLLSAGANPLDCEAFSYGNETVTTILLQLMISRGHTQARMVEYRLNAHHIRDERYGFSGSGKK
ncbi:hypothetical protein NA57DRAFT_59192 [Rhizodiscina lignyota]|uniref:Clr5 domain-containing protein n=1 Tax=Rhizodiscina lignyota TaxID=1504668 RepID=A0A9P4I8W9_9PEZI|nr:hypothetical protein NA57DRAFT_59192 [Rhizodiscina lignyota]